MTAGITMDTMGNPRRMTRNYGTDTHTHTDKKDQRGTHRGSSERGGRENQSECTNWLLLLWRSCSAESSRGIGTRIPRAGRMQQDTHTHTHNVHNAHMRGKTLGKVNLLIRSKKVTRQWQKKEGKLLPVAVCFPSIGNMLQVRAREQSSWQLNCSRLRRGRSRTTIDDRRGNNRCAIEGNRKLFFCSGFSLSPPLCHSVYAASKLIISV